MKKILLLISVLIAAFLMSASGAWAQETSAEEFTLEEITVTAEKREVNVQKIPASVQALVGSDLMEQGKITTEQILEDVPNVTFRPGKGENPNGNIAIRGFQSSQESGVGGAGPSVTATYVDDVFQGIGGNYDVNRVEILRGPQGTLYGRSSPAGVIAFHTNDPILDEFSANVFTEIGTDDLVNMQVAINGPISDKIALRAAGHFFEKSDPYALAGVHDETKEGRVKILYQPSEELGLLASLSAQKNTPFGGGYFQTLVAPNEIDYYGTYADPVQDITQRYRQAYIKANYDFGDSTLTYIGAIHDYESEGRGAPKAKKGGGLGVSEDTMPINEYITHEARLASDSEGSLTWQIGANYFQHEFDTGMESLQLDYPAGETYPTAADLAANPNASANDLIGAPAFKELHKGTIKNYALFTEETFNLSDEFRVTAGLRYDKTKINENKSFVMNDNLTDARNALNPPIWLSKSYTDNPEFDNITYKLRFEYDLSPDHMVYALTATGFMPGQSGASPLQGIKPDGSFGVLGWNVLLLQEKELTSYEIGSKSQLLDNTLRLNSAVYYYKYEGYQEAVNMTGGAPPIFTLVTVPLKMTGAEVSAQWLITAKDRVSMDLGALSAEIDGHTAIAGAGTTADWMKLQHVPGHPSMQVTLSYDHSFLFNNGSALVPRVQLRYNRGHYLSQFGQAEIDMRSSHGYDVYAYDYQDNYIISDLNFTWTSADGNYSLTGYIRNALDERYKNSITLAGLQGPPGGPMVLSDTTVTVNDPRTFGLMFRAKF